MKIVQPSYEIIECPIDALEKIERAARTCYKSEDRITEGSAERLVKSLIVRGHYAMIEFGGIIWVKFTTNRGMSHEAVRHRLSSYAQECIAGDTVVWKGRTVQELFECTRVRCGEILNKEIGLRSCDDTRVIVDNAVLNIFYKGTGYVFSVVTRLGYTIKVTADHEFMVGDGSFRKLRHIMVGDTVQVTYGLQTGCEIYSDTIVSIIPVGETDVFDIEMAAPYHNYVANGFVVHNSTRYCNYAKDKFGNEVTFIDPQTIVQKSMTSKSVDMWFLGCDATFRFTEEWYLKMIDSGVPAQLAREILPIGLKTELNVQANLVQWRHIFKQRTANGAHPRMKELMRPLLKEVSQLIPVVFDDLVDAWK